MDDVFLSTRVGGSRVLCISPLSGQTYKSSGAKGLGGEYGYFVYEYDEAHPHLGIEVIAKAVSLEAAHRLFELLSDTLAVKAVA